MTMNIQKTLTNLESKGIEPYLIKISIQSDINIGDLSDYIDRNVNKYFIDIELYNDDNYEEKEVIGGIIAYHINSYDWADEEFINLILAADAIYGDLLTSIYPIVDNDGYLLDNYLGSSILYIDKFYIQPAYRGKGIGSLVFPVVINTIGRDVGAVTIIPTPTEGDGENEISKEDERYGTILNRMCKFIMKYGFYRVDHENRVWVKNTAMRD